MPLSKLSARVAMLFADIMLVACAPETTTNGARPIETQSFSSGEPQIDSDCDGVANLVELVDLSSDPLGLPGCCSPPTTELSDTAQAGNVQGDSTQANPFGLCEISGKAS